MRAAPYLYALSLPERTVRSLSALSGGILREMSELALPAKVREAALYRATAGIGLRFLIEQLGDVDGIYPRQDPLARQFVGRYAIGSSIEMVGVATIFLSPVWVLAALGDATRVGKTVFSEIGDALKAEGLLDPDAQFETMAQLLDGMERTSTHLALTVNMPPLDVAGLRQEWEQFRENLAILPPARLPTAADVERAWNNLQTVSRECAAIRFQRVGRYGHVGALVRASAAPMALPFGRCRCPHYRSGRWRRIPRPLRGCL